MTAWSLCRTSEASPLEIVSPPWLLGTPAPELVECMFAELKAMFLLCPVLEVNGCEGVLLLGLLMTVDALPAAYAFRL